MNAYETIATDLIRNDTELLVACNSPAKLYLTMLCDDESFTQLPDLDLFKPSLITISEELGEDSGYDRVETLEILRRNQRVHALRRLANALAKWRGQGRDPEGRFQPLDLVQLSSTLRGAILAYHTAWR